VTDWSGSAGSAARDDRRDGRDVGGDADLAARQPDDVVLVLARAQHALSDCLTV
jgi:hypothetical protein